MKNYSFLRYIGAVCGLCIIVAGCASTPPTKFYRMSSLDSPGSQERRTAAGDSLAIGVGPVKIAEYIDRPQIVTRIGENEFRVAEFNRWAGSLGGEISRILAENLSTLLYTDKVYIFPWRDSAPVDFQVMVDIEHLDGRAGDNVFLQARWAVLEGNGGNVLQRKSRYTEQVKGEDYSALVEAASLALAGLSRDIAAAIDSTSSDASYK